MVIHRDHVLGEVTNLWELIQAAQEENRKADDAALRALIESDHEEHKAAKEEA
jgi:hypothetical protein